MYEKLMQILVETGADIAECKNIRFENGRLQDCGSDSNTVKKSILMH